MAGREVLCIARKMVFIGAGRLVVYAFAEGEQVRVESAF